MGDRSGKSLRPERESHRAHPLLPGPPLGPSTRRGRPRTRRARGRSPVAATGARDRRATRRPSAASYTDPARRHRPSLNDLTPGDGGPPATARCACACAVTDLRAASDGGPGGPQPSGSTPIAASRRPGPAPGAPACRAGPTTSWSVPRGWKPSSGPLDAVRTRCGCARPRTLADLRISRRCLGADVDEARVAVRMDDHDDASHPVRDWLGKRRSFTPWLARG